MNNFEKHHIPLIELSRRLICVPKCASCMTRLDVITDKNASRGLSCMCEKCLSEWERAKSAMCHTCGKTADSCTCMPLKNTFMQPTIPSLFFYHPNDKKPQSKAIYTLKHKKYIDLFDFFTDELSPRLKSLLDELEIPAEDCIFTYVPRTKKALRRNGFDQGKLISEKLCAKTGGSACLPLLSRTGGKEQKKLDGKEQRKENLKRSIYLNTSMRGISEQGSDLSSLLNGRTVILSDDIITAGATLARAVKLLRASGAQTVIVCSVARSEIRQKKTKSS